MKYLNTFLKLPKLAIALTLLIFLYFIETVLMVVYVSVDKPLSFLLDKIELTIKYIVKSI